MARNSFQKLTAAQIAQRRGKENLRADLESRVKALMEHKTDNWQMQNIAMRAADALVYLFEDLAAIIDEGGMDLEDAITAVFAGVNIGIREQFGKALGRKMAERYMTQSAGR